MPTQLPIPEPPRRSCTRYKADGTPCDAKTVRADGWCGICDGFLKSTPVPSREISYLMFSNSAMKWTPVPAPLEADEAYDVHVKKAALSEYATRHRCTRDQAEVEIRSLLEDLLMSGQSDFSEKRGEFRLMFKKDGYLLLLSRSREVTGYRSLHAERTWKQVKGGVKSRFVHGGARGGKLNRLLSELVQGQKGNLIFAYSALNRYSRLFFGEKVTLGNAQSVMDSGIAYITREIAPHIKKTLIRGDQEIIDSHGFRWVIRRFDSGTYAAIYVESEKDPTLGH